MEDSPIRNISILKRGRQIIELSYRLTREYEMRLTVKGAATKSFNTPEYLF